MSAHKDDYSLVLQRQTAGKLYALNVDNLLQVEVEYISVEPMGCTKNIAIAIEGGASGPAARVTLNY